MRWKQMLVCAGIFAVGGLAGLTAQPPDRTTDVGVEWARMSAGLIHETHALSWAAEQRYESERQFAAWEWRVVATYEAQELARRIWLAAGQAQEQTGDPQAFGLQQQSLFTATGHYTQRLQGPLQVRSETLQLATRRLDQARQAEWNSLWNELQNRLRSMMTQPRQVEEPAEPADFGELVDALLPSPPGEAEAAYLQKADAERKAFLQVLDETTAAWREQAAAATPPGADLAEADAALKQANLEWRATALDALERYRTETGAALRQYQRLGEGIQPQ